MARSKRGGYQRPSKPAAVSGPGALSQRTDGGPSVEYSGLPYGENKALNDQAAAAPLTQSGAAGAVGPSPRRPSPQMGPDGIFGPSEYPDQAMTSGIDAGPGAGAPQQYLDDDPDILLRALQQAYPHPDLDHLLARRARG